MTPWQIADGIRTWCNWPGFTAETCHHCKTRVNTFAGGLGYHCPRCNHHNAQSMHGHRIPYRNPEFGPTRATIRRGGRIAGRYSERAHKFTVGQKVWADRSLWSFPSQSKVQCAKIVGIPQKSWASYEVEFDEPEFPYKTQIHRVSRDKICARPRGSSSLRFELCRRWATWGLEEIPVFILAREIQLAAN